MTAILLQERANGVLRLTFNRPQARNALSVALMTTLVETLGRAAGDVETRVVVIAGAGPAFCAEEARFATPGVNIGLFCSTPMVALSRTVGRKAAMEMLLTGELIDAATARALGLVNRVVPRDELRAAVDALAHQIAGKSAFTVRIGKEAFYRQAELDLAGAYRYAAEVMTTNMLARDAEEGIDAFLEKRAPVWHDR